MSAAKGGPAFPCPASRHDQLELGILEHSGVTARDYFAAKALVGMIAAMSDNAVRKMMIENAVDGERTPEQQVAFSAYEYADAMLAERAK